MITPPGLSKSLQIWGLQTAYLNAKPNSGLWQSSPENDWKQHSQEKVLEEVGGSGVFVFLFLPALSTSPSKRHYAQWEYGQRWLLTTLKPQLQ